MSRPLTWECRAAQSRQARPEEAQEPSWGAAKGDSLTMLRHSTLAIERAHGRRVVSWHEAMARGLAVEHT